VSSIAGPVDIVEKTPDGKVFVTPQSFSCGVNIVAASATLLPPQGNPYIQISGFGLYSDPFTAGTGRVGGQLGTNSQVDIDARIANALPQVFVQIPNGKSGASDISITSNQGTGTFSAAVCYIPGVNILPATGLLQLLYDSRRSLLYALKSGEVDVLNPATLQWQAPILPGESSGPGYVSMTLTPDGSKLLIADSVRNVLTSVNPDNPSQKTDISLLASPAGSIVATKTGKVFIGGTNVEVDLASQTAVLKFGFPGEYTGTPDGAHVVGTQFSISSGLMYVWDSASDSSSSQGFDQGFWTDVAIANDGSTIAALEGLPGFGGVIVGFFDEQLHYLNTNVYPDLVPVLATQVLGAMYTASGTTLIAPSEDSLDFFDVKTGALKGRLLTPEPLESLNFPDVMSGNIALDPQEKTIYSISQSGLTVMQLATPINQITPPVWPLAIKTSRAASADAKAAMPRVHAAGKSR
jgi:hypothetical protein